MRHGKTLDNVKGVLMGSNDPPLIPEAEAEIVAMRPFVIQPDLVFSSDLRRARDTARLLFPRHEVTALPLFRERNRGAFQGKPTRLWRDAIAARGAASELECEDDAFAEAGVESLSALRSRAEQVMELMKRVEATTVVVVSHGFFITCLLRLIQPTRGIQHSLSNLHYHKITLTDAGVVIDVQVNQAWSNQRA
jgi:alpha-ribazole phosphatase